MGTEKGALFGATGFKWLEGDFAVFLLLELLDFKFGFLQAGFAGFEQFRAFFIFREQLCKRYFALFHRVNDGLELEQCALKIEFGSLV